MVWNVLKIIWSPATLLRIITDIVSLLREIKAHPEYGDKAVSLLERLKSFVS